MATTKKSEWIGLAIAICALATAGLETWRARSRDSVHAEVSASREIQAEERYKATREAIGALQEIVQDQQEQITILRESVAALKTATEFLAQDRKWKARKEAEAVAPIMGKPKPRREFYELPDAFPEPDATAVQQKATMMFER